MTVLVICCGVSLVTTPSSEKWRIHKQIPSRLSSLSAKTKTLKMRGFCRIRVHRTYSNRTSNVSDVLIPTYEFDRLQTRLKIDGYTPIRKGRSFSLEDKSVFSFLARLTIDYSLSILDPSSRELSYQSSIPPRIKSIPDFASHASFYPTQD